MNKFIEISGTLGLEDTQLKVQFYLNSSRLDSTNTNREVRVILYYNTNYNTGILEKFPLPNILIFNKITPPPLNSPLSSFKLTTALYCVCGILRLS